MTAQVRWRSPVQLHHPQREFELPAERAGVLEALLADAPLPAEGGEPQRWRQAIVQASTLVRLHEARVARARARDSRWPPTMACCPHRRSDAASWSQSRRTCAPRLKQQAAWAVLHEDLGQCDAEHVALAAGLPAARADELVDEEGRHRTRDD
jgi:hypothetical protein